MLLEIGLFIKRKTKNQKTEKKNQNNNNNNNNYFFIVSFFFFFFCQPGGVEESEICKILWDMTIQCDHIIEATRPDIVVVEKESNKSIIMDIARHGIKRRVQRLRNAKI